jgi:predicted DNA-binding protein with PD1-like motif
MKVLDSGPGIYALRLEIGEELWSSLIQAAEKLGVSTAEVTAIGALKDSEIGWYKLSEKKYQKRTFTENAELILCSGTITQKEGKPFPHLHVALGLRDLTVVGGHFFSGIVAVTVEAILRPLSETVFRKFDDETGLFLWDLGETL